MDLHIEFSEQFEREKLHHQFTKSLYRLTLAAFAVIFGIAFVSDGGKLPELLPILFGTTFFALACELLAFGKRVLNGALLSTGFLLFVPWLLLLLVDALALSPFPGKAELALCSNLIPLTLFFIAQQQSRGNGNQSGLLAWTIALLTLGLIAGISYQVYIREDFSGTLSMNFLSGFLSDPVAPGAVALLIFFGSLVPALHRGSEPRKRLIALYLAIAALALIFLTRNTGVWIAFLVGSLVVVGLVFSKKATRVGLALILACSIALAPLASEMPFSLPNKILSTQDANNEAADEVPSPLALQKIALKVFEQNPVCGTGSGSFASEFQKHSPQSWQFSPATSNNLYTLILAENGVLGFLLLIVPVAGIAIAAWRFCSKIPRGKHHRRAHFRDDDDSAERANTRIRIAGLLGGIVAVGTLCALDFSPGFFPAILGCAVFGGILMHEIGGPRFNRVYAWNGNKRKALFVLAALLPAGLFLLCLPASYSAAQCARGKQALAPFIADFYKNASPVPVSSDIAEIQTPLLNAVAAQPNNADAWIALAQSYAYSIYLNPEKAVPLENAMFYAAERACEHAPRSAQAHFVKAVAEILLKKDDAAARSLECAESLAPNNLPLLYQIAEAYRLMSDEHPAVKRLTNRLTAIAPNAERVRQLSAIVHLLDLNKGTNEKSDPETPASLFEF